MFIRNRYPTGGWEKDIALNFVTHTRNRKSKNTSNRRKFKVLFTHSCNSVRSFE